MKNLIALLFILCFFLVSCSPKINSEQQEKLNKLTEEVDSVATVFRALDSTQLFDLSADFFEKKKYLQEKMSDTLTPTLIFRVDAFLQLRKAMGFIVSEYSPISIETSLTKKQMDDLNQDVENRLIDEKQFERYYEIELKNFEQLKYATERFVDITSNAQKTYKETSPVADSLIAAYKESSNE